MTQKTEPPQNETNHVQLMDSMYRMQRYFYDASRKFYLFGRDLLIKELPVKTGDHILEVGCGTGRNLIMLAKKHPTAFFWGLDASNEMLKTASAKIESKGLSNRIALRHGLAEDLHPQNMFNHDEPFDVIFFSYSLSMIPGWEGSVDVAMKHIKPGGYLYLVDFWDQEKLPKWFQGLLQAWLRLFHVKHDPKMIPYLQKTAKEYKTELKLTSVMGQYAFLAAIQKPE